MPMYQYYINDIKSFFALLLQLPEIIIMLFQEMWNQANCRLGIILGLIGLLTIIPLYLWKRTFLAEVKKYYPKEKILFNDPVHIIGCCYVQFILFSMYGTFFIYPVFYLGLNSISIFKYIIFIFTIIVHIFIYFSFYYMFVVTNNRIIFKTLNIKNLLIFHSKEQKYYTEFLISQIDNIETQFGAYNSMSLRVKLKNNKEIELKSFFTNKLLNILNNLKNKAKNENKSNKEQ